MVIAAVDLTGLYLYIYTHDYLYVTFYSEVEVLKEWDYKKRICNHRSLYTE